MAQERTQAQENPYLSARKEYGDRYGSAVRDAARWRQISILMVMLFMVVVFLMIMSFFSFVIVVFAGRMVVIVVLIFLHAFHDLFFAHPVSKDIHQV